MTSDVRFMLRALLVTLIVVTVFAALTVSRADAQDGPCPDGWKDTSVGSTEFCRHPSDTYSTTAANAHKTVNGERYTSHYSPDIEHQRSPSGHVSTHIPDGKNIHYARFAHLCESTGLVKHGSGCASPAPAEAEAVAYDCWNYPTDKEC